MGTHNVFDNNQCPCGPINDPIVDKLLGNAYQVVKYVAMNMPAIKVVSDEITSILAVYAKLKELGDIQAKIPELMEVQAALPHLEVLHTNLVQLLTLYTHIDELVKVATGIDDIHTITPHLQELTTVAANITEVVATGTNISKVIAVANSITSVNKLAPVTAEIDNLAQNVQALVSINTHLPELLNIEHHLPDLLNIETPLSKLVINSFEALRRTYSEAGLALVTGSFEDGAKVTTKQDVVLERKTGKGYNWRGNIPSDGKVIPVGSTPNSAGGIGSSKWVDASAITLREPITAQSREALRRTYIEAGFNLVEGSFEAGGVLRDDFDVLLHEQSGVAYSGPKGVVSPGTDPNSDGFIDRNGETLSGKLTASGATIPEIAGLPDKVYGIDYAKYPSCADFIGKAPFSIECWGDSTMWGSVSNNPSVQDGNNPVAVFAKTLAHIYGSGSPSVVNRAIPGSNLDSMIHGKHLYPKNFDTEMSLSTASIIYCNHAQNDCNNSAQTVAQFRVNLIAFVNICRKHGKVPVLVTPNMSFVAGGVTEIDTKNLPSFVEAIRDVATAMSVDLVDNYYYYYKTSRSISMSELLPDGVHPSTKAYGMSGRNLAIPLVAASKLGSQYDGAGLSNAGFRDDFKSSRYLQSNTDSKFGNVIICETEGTGQRLSYPVILDTPTTDTVIAFSTLSWPDGGKMYAMYDNSIEDPNFNGVIDVFDASSVNYKGLVSPLVCNLYAGLHIVGVYAANDAPAGASKMSFGGVVLLPRIGLLSPVRHNYANKQQGWTRPVLIGDTIETTVSVGSTDKYLIQIGSTNTEAEPWLFVSRKDGEILVSVFGVVTTLPSGSSVQPGIYPLTVKLLSDRTVECTLGSLTVKTPVSLKGIPLSYVAAYYPQDVIVSYVSR